MTRVRLCLILPVDVHMVSVHLKRSLRNWRRFSEIIRHGALERQTLVDVHLQFKPQLVN